jgi:DNL zinc finger
LHQLIFRNAFTRISLKSPYRLFRNGPLFAQIQHPKGLVINTSATFHWYQQQQFCSQQQPDGIPIGKLDGRLNLIYTCGVCQSRNSHFISKQAYEKGVVIVTCESCENKHLIADNLDWFKDMEEKNIEQMMAKKGEMVLKVKPVSDKVFEYSE